ncbi:hypothetical protein Kpol_1065p43 [Vanderwaltozyma polyspora DSM 70294]|uniref:Eukaryotic translation initiation factor 3 subunit A n=1 Tax=Vanderwaltozyma polyspora (strain ATCC 22028 / DSM 70294 / BCRC 21397 / CBS 2163 / NBRC 10782 / NRRL Y-8283 / UCD 57-17) TaxID=436907 RepID=EIF3A_VANPO|nr:uncharacterized protein Kpol_1065p43 [Vanderwaltozyma polyspora DSM 70294]A7TL64.1 RecName: Full=Eukaryotic translation initiation factor 3 subunit A; Short=eIF3a; AltName: Full=Eukaryotic translation initiation factor 3 110 kDa subunit homolog; Short=eIF3 p110; AltName: Full=Translation initiation factor eIF3, p110 subunit homolog [Vanderwaltozyma polyspora DSM 70294]EDO17027.1 hypothetical protein Kpol_1065p43 [Vanderwaltozyma polyspora DSM 70294]
MAPPVLRPDNAIKRADELISVGESQAALQSLYEYLTARKIRFAQPSTVEPIVFKFLELGVDLKRGRLIKDALHQYKKLVQGSQDGLSSVGAVARKFIDCVETKMAFEHLKAEESQTEEDDDLEGGVTPENLLKSVYIQDQSVAGFNDEVVTSWLKFTWESYRAVLDLVRNNSQLEITYAGVVNRTMQFCLKYNRKNEFKRLAEMLRQHLDAANYQQSKIGSNIVDLSDSETLQRYLDQRFLQLNVSVKLELWHEAFRSIEDVYHLMKMSKHTPKSSTLANYYENLAKVFLISNAQLLHTATWEKFYRLYQSNPNATEEDFKKYSSIILLSALSTPLDILPTVGYDPQMRLYRLLGLESRPTRNEMIELAKQEDIYKHIDEDIIKLYEIMEINYNADTIKTEIAALLPKLEAKPYFKQYINQLRNVLLRKNYVSLSETENAIPTDALYDKASLPGVLSLPHWDMEKTLLQAAVEDYVSISIDHDSNTVTFFKDPFEIISKAAGTVEEEEEEEEEEGEEVEGEEAETGEEIVEEGEEHENEENKEPEPVITRTTFIRNRLAELSNVLEEIDAFKNASYLEKVKLARETLITQTKDSIENLKQIAEDRAKRAQEQKKKYMASAAVRAEEDAEIRQRQILEEKAALEAKLEQDAHRRLVEKKKREFEDLKQREIQKFIDEFNKKDHAAKIASEEVQGLDIKEIKTLIFSKLSQDKSELEDRMTSSLQKLDHAERAYRKSELPLLRKEAESLKETDMNKFNDMKSKIVDTARAEFDAKMEDHNRLVGVYNDYVSLKDRLTTTVEEKFKLIRAENAAKFEAAKKARIEEVRKQRYEELVAERKAEIEAEEREERAKKQEETARKQKEMEEAAERKSKASSAAAAKSILTGGNDARSAKLDEIARRQREIEQAAERKAQGPSASTEAPDDEGRNLTYAEKMKLRRASKK